jgi:hypothetical protein
MGSARSGGFYVIRFGTFKASARRNGEDLETVQEAAQGGIPPKGDADADRRQEGQGDAGEEIRI